jgi:hypothetical protein
VISGWKTKPVIRFTRVCLSKSHSITAYEWKVHSKYLLCEKFHYKSWKKLMLPSQNITLLYLREFRKWFKICFKSSFSTPLKVVTWKFTCFQNHNNWSLDLSRSKTIKLCCIYGRGAFSLLYFYSSMGFHWIIPLKEIRKFLHKTCVTVKNWE